MGEILPPPTFLKPFIESIKNPSCAPFIRETDTLEAVFWRAGMKVKSDRQIQSQHGCHHRTAYCGIPRTGRGSPGFSLRR